MLIKNVLLLIFLCSSTISIYKLRSLETGIQTFSETLNGTPVIITGPKQPSESLIFISHGFAGSTSFMRSIAVSLAQSGFTTVRFDYLGHGRHPLHYSGDVTSPAGATQLFLKQTKKIINHYSKSSEGSNHIIIGHSMAADIIFRAALVSNTISGAIGISSYTNEIKLNSPKNVLLISGEWEPRLRKKAMDILSSIGITTPLEGVTYGAFDTNSARQASFIKKTGHVSVLYSTETQKRILSWINRVLKSESSVVTNQMGLWTTNLFISLCASFILFVQLLPKKQLTKIKISYKNTLFANVFATLVTPLILKIHFFDFTPFPSHSYLINHILLYSLLVLPFLPLKSLKKTLPGSFNFLIVLSLFIFYAFFLGGVIDSYFSSFYPSLARLKLFVYLLVGCLPLSLLIQLFYSSNANQFLMASTTKVGVIVSLSIAIFLNFGTLFLLAYAILLFLAFYFVFGLLSSLLNKRYNNYLGIGFVNGLLLAWTFSTALPLYIP